MLFPSFVFCVFLELKKAPKLITYRQSEPFLTDAKRIELATKVLINEYKRHAETIKRQSREKRKS